MDNYMFGAASNARQFLMQPQLERERQADRAAVEEQRRRQNAYQDFQMEQARLQLEAAQRAQLAEAKARAQAAFNQRDDAQAIAEGLGLRSRSQAGAFQGINGQMGPVNIPGKPGYVPPGAGAVGVPAPMGGPPAMSTVPNGGTGTVPNQGTAQPGMVEQIDPATGQPVGVVTVTGQGIRPTQPWEGLRQMSPQELNQRRLAAAYERQDWAMVAQLGPQVFSEMTDEEKRGRQLIGSAAVQILQLPREQRPAAIQMALQRFGIDPATVMIDDITDPAQLETALRFEAFLGDPGGWMEEQTRVQGTRDEYRRPEMVNQGNQQSLVSMSGTNPGAVLGRFQVQPSPNAVLSAQTQVQIARENNALRRVLAEIDRDTTLTVEQKRDARAAANRASQERIAVLTGRTIGEDEALGSYVDNPEF